MSILKPCPCCNGPCVVNDSSKYIMCLDCAYTVPGHTAHDRVTESLDEKAAARAYTFKLEQELLASTKVCNTLKRILNKEVSRRKQAQSLLAVIHRDGGQYTIEHGWEKAIDDAKAIYRKIAQCVSPRFFI
jgi:hypothetical protein